MTATPFQALTASDTPMDGMTHQQRRPMADTSSSGIPLVYRGQQFPSRKALAKHLAPLLGRSVGALAMALSRYNVEHVIIEYRTEFDCQQRIRVRSATGASNFRAAPRWPTIWRRWWARRNRR